MNFYEDILEEVSKVFVNQPLDPKGCNSDPLRPPRLPRYFGLPMVNPSRPPLPPNNEIDDAKIVNLFSFTFKDIMFDWCNNYIRDYPNCTFVELQLTFCKRY